MRAGRIIIGALLIVAGILGYQLHQQREQTRRAREELGLDASRVLSAIFTQAKDLRVARLSGEVMAQSSNDGTIFRTTQRTIAPYSVNYFINLGSIDGSDYRWDAERREMTVVVPDVTVEQPSLNLSKARMWQDGIWVSREAGMKLQRQAAAHLGIGAAKKAKDPENISKARQSGRLAVEQMVRLPLEAAGFRNVTVKTIYPWQRNKERWDMSRSLQDVLANAQ